MAEKQRPDVKKTIEGYFLRCLFLQGMGKEFIFAGENSWNGAAVFKNASAVRKNVGGAFKNAGCVLSFDICFRELLNIKS